MKTDRTLAALTPLALIATTALAGDLNPPAGPVAPTMKSLDQIEPRVCINDLPGSMTATHSITEPGNYYLTADIIGEAGKNGIEIDLSVGGGVTIDLNGFALVGVAGSLDGVHGRDLGGHEEWINLGNSNQGWAIGHIGENGTGASINGWDDDGVDFDGFDEVRVSGIGIRNCGGNGVHVKTASRTLVDKAYVDNQVGNGILVEGSEEAFITASSVSNTGGDGVHISSIGSIAITNVYVVNDIAERDCLGAGIRVRCANGDGAVSLSNITTTGNGESGIEADFTGASGGTLTLGGTTTLNNALHGIHVHGTGLTPAAGQETIEICIGYSEEYLNATDNGGDGVNIAFDNSIAPMIHIDNATCNDNTLDGINVSALSPTTRSHTRIRRGMQNYNGGNGVTVTGNLEINGATIGNNGGHGVEFFETGDIPTEEQFANLIDSFIHRNDDGVNGTDSDLTIRGCNISHNAGDGVDFSASTGNTNLTLQIAGETACNSNGGHGLFAQDIDGNSGLDRFTANDNGGNGVLATSSGGLPCGAATLTNCVTNNNTVSGIELACSSGGTVRRCESSNNGNVGFLISGFGHTVIENNAANNGGGGYSVPLPGNSVAPIVDEPGLATNTNPHANLVR